MPETRSSERFSDLEQRLDLQQGTIDSIHSRLEQHSLDITELKTTNARLEGYLKDISAKLSDAGKRPASTNGEGASRAVTPPRVPPFGTFSEILTPPPPPYVVPTRQTRIEFPKFDGEDFRGWAYRCRQFFEVDGTPQDQRIRLLSIHLEGHALRWHQTFMKHRSYSELGGMSISVA